VKTRGWAGVSGGATGRKPVAGDDRMLSRVVPVAQVRRGAPVDETVSLASWASYVEATSDTGVLSSSGSR
jgi:hypothetical protein